MPGHTLMHQQLILLDYNIDSIIFCFIFDSIEKQMLDIQEKKKDLIAGAFRQTEQQRREQRIRDIRDMFGL